MTCNVQTDLPRWRRYKIAQSLASIHGCQLLAISRFTDHCDRATGFRSTGVFVDDEDEEELKERWEPRFRQQSLLQLILARQLRTDHQLD